MGIDFLDIMYRVERSFGIRLDVRKDFDFSSGKYLVGDFYDLVERKVCAASKEILESQNYREKIFRDVKQALSEELDIEDNWTEETTVRQLYEQIPESRRKKTWINFGGENKNPLINTVENILRSRIHGNLWFAWGGYVFCVFILSFFIGQFFFQSGLLTFLICFFPGSLLWSIIWEKYDKYRRCRHVPEMPLGEIADIIIAHQKMSLKKDGSPYTREEIEEIVKTVICEALAVKPEDVTPDADMLRDLGME